MVHSINTQLQVQQLFQTPNRRKFGGTSAVANAWYNPMSNSINLPLGMLLQPFWVLNFPLAVNYGIQGNKNNISDFMLSFCSFESFFKHPIVLFFYYVSTAFRTKNGQDQEYAVHNADLNLRDCFNYTMVFM